MVELANVDNPRCSFKDLQRVGDLLGVVLSARSLRLHVVVVQVEMNATPPSITLRELEEGYAKWRKGSNNNAGCPDVAGYFHRDLVSGLR